LTSDISTVANGSISVLSQLISLGVQLVAAFTTLMFLEPNLAVLAFLLAPFTVLFSRIYGKKLRGLHLKMQETESIYRSHMQEYIQNLLVIKTFNLEENSLGKVGELQKERLYWVTERSKTGATANSILSLGYWTGYFLAFGWGVIKLSKKTASFGTLTAFLQLVNQIQSPFIGLSRTLPQIIASLASAGRLIEIENLNSEAKGEKLVIPDFAGIRFSNVNFRYIEDEAVLNNISMDVAPGDVVALIGMSGEGKTTMIRLMLALLKPQSGELVCSDGKGSEYFISATTRSWFSYVPQGNTLFSGTIADNLRSGKPDASDEEMKEALHAACALEFVERLPESINTLIGEKALGLSEGQAQRIAIARALLRKAPIIILDEATSALDLELEERIIQSLRKMKPVRTCIMITHRRTSLGICNKIYKLNNGNLFIEK
jgi:ABC-type multidrug transport system, ATPase and permease components